MTSARWIVMLVAVACVLFLSAPAWCAETIEGPVAFTGNESGHSNHGIVFDSLDYVRILGFDFHNQGKADTVQLIYEGEILYSLNTPVANPVYTAVVDWLLAPGANYYLVGTTTANGRFAFYSFPATNSHISVTSAIFSGNTGQVNWADFRNIVTEQASEPSGNGIPEPTTIALVGLGMLALYTMRGKQVH